MKSNQPPETNACSPQVTDDNALSMDAFLAVLECSKTEAEAHLAALDVLVVNYNGDVSVTDVTSTCWAITMHIGSEMMPRIKAALKLAGATILPPEPAQRSRAVVIMTIWDQMDRTEYE